MAVENDTSVTDFFLMVLADQPELQLPLFFLFLVNYVVTVLGNLSLSNLICVISHLHMPMCFFLFNLSFIDLCYSFVFTPKMLISFNLFRNIIAFSGWMAQLFFFCFFFVSSEFYVLTAMACEHYEAICKPLLYTVTMSPNVCSLLMSGSYVMALAGVIAHTGCMIRLTICDSNIINHDMCDIFPLIQLSCSSTFANELVSSIGVGIVVMVSSLIICISYALILCNILYVSSAKGWSKAFSTCSFHLITVGLLYGFGMLSYVKPSSYGPLEQKFLSVFYTNVVPRLNPLSEKFPD